MVSKEHFKDNLITDSCIIDNVHELFVSVYLSYCMDLEKSLGNRKNKISYNYILIEASVLYKIIDRINDSVLGIRPITMLDILLFKEALIYIGKGQKDRKDSHLKEAFKLLIGKLDEALITEKHTRIVNAWMHGEGIVVLQFLNDSDSFLSLCRESAMIKSAGDNLSNVRNGSAYGSMKNKWTNTEILNFGEMLLYFSLKQCILERPSPIFPDNLEKHY